MRNVFLVVAGVVGLQSLAPGAIAADLGTPTRAPESAISYETYQPQSAPHRNFYIRGDVGIGQYNFGGFSQAELADKGGDFLSRSIADTVTIGAGIGWQFNQRFRADLTGEYRSKSQIKALDNLTGDLVDPLGIPYATLQSNTLYQANLSSYVGLLNGYWDIINWRGFTPYVGAGIGVAMNTVSGLTSTGSSTVTDTTTGDVTLQAHTGYAASHSQANLAWALMAGTSYDLSANAKLDLGYRYINLGSGTTASSGINICTCGITGGPLKFADIDAHEFRLGIRWSLTPDPVRYVPPAPEPLK